jgi:addiction module RelE/StbE family toxin
MEIVLNPSFRKAYRKSRLKIQQAFAKRLRLFKENLNHPLLRDHQLTGKLEGHRAFSITGDIRVVYYIHEETAYFIDIGTHNQVYGK